MLERLVYIKVAFGRSDWLQKGFGISVFSIFDGEFQGEAPHNSPARGLRMFWGDRSPSSGTDLSLSQDVGKEALVTCPCIFEFYTVNETHKQYTLLDTIFNYIFYF